MKAVRTVFVNYWPAAAIVSLLWHGASLLSAPFEPIPQSLIGTWQVSKVLIDTEATRTLQYQYDDARLTGRLVTIASGEVTANLPEKSDCINPSVRRQSTTATALLHDTMGGRSDPPAYPSPKDYKLPASGGSSDAVWFKCASGSLGPNGPRGPDGENWVLLLPNDRLAMRWFDNTILLLDRVPKVAKPTPSFDCSKAATPVEKAICGSIALAAFDRSVAESYRSAINQQKETGDAKSLKAVQDSQRQWLAKRNACGADAACLQKAMQARLEELAQP
ncbi:MAG TPA: lysozyme inhibitor LprI family protein [Bryobacteraceae bacterium]|nr:lysozyme inhibitor LprI family protein [Bryobacteraceae bacterium]